MSDAEQVWAVRGQDLKLGYGHGASHVAVLKRLSLSVPAGSIYALLGPSGCGKTTLLRCILGRLKAEGSLAVLGRTPRSPGHQVPGVLVGYMPQEVALAPNFSIFETLQYFGMLHGMSSLQVKQRTEFLLRLLDLPPQNKLISQLSGGQQRRVSFAVALLQRPPLVILDEPTVGVDPVLRARIWQHLRELVADGQTTVIITTHYIEEARQADMVAMMRAGRLLAEDPPDHLLQFYNLETLEAVFLRLSERSDSCLEEDYLNADRRNIQDGAESSSELDGPDSCTSSVTRQASYQHLGNKQSFIRGFSCMNILAMVWKNATIRKRMPLFLLFELLLPTLEISLFCLAIGRAPTGLSLGVVNEDTGFFGVTLSQTYVDCLAAQKHVLLQQDANLSISDALQEVKKGRSWGYLHFDEDFSSAFVERTQSPYTVDNDTISNSSIHVRLDMSNQQIALVIEEDITAAFQCFEKTLLVKYASLLHPGKAINPNSVSSPIEVGPPVYGALQPRFTDFVAPGIIVAMTFVMSIGLTALSVIIERKQGLLDRTRAAGVTDIELLAALTLTQLAILIGQMVLMIVVAVEGFKVRNDGPLALLFLIVILQGLTGMAYGLLLSAVCSDETSAVVVAMGSVFPTLLLSGILWPLQGMSTWLRYISYCMPNTFAATAVRDIMGRGWSLGHLDVGLGLAITCAWLISFFFISLVSLRRQTH
eukprot:scpid21523/ scgid0343/ ABC transporter G family member 23; ABC transporter ABCG.23